MDRLAELEAFVQVVEAGGIGLAAQRLGVAKSAVSRRLKELEARLGVRLVNRTTRRLSLTETGRAYYDRATVILADVEEADQAAAAVHGTLNGRMRVAAPMTFGVGHLAPAIAEFLWLHQNLVIDMDLNDRHVDLVEEGFDIAIRIGTLEDSSLIARRLFEVRHIVCASPNYLARHGTPERPEDLTRHRGLVYLNSSDRRAWIWTDADGERRSVQPLPAALAANNGEFLVASAEAGLGLGLMPSFIACRAIESGRLVPVLTDVAWQGSGCYAVYPPGRHLSAKVRAFVDFLAERFAGTPYWETCLNAVDCVDRDSRAQQTAAQ